MCNNTLASHKPGSARLAARLTTISTIASAGSTTTQAARCNQSEQHRTPEDHAIDATIRTTIGNTTKSNRNTNSTTSTKITRNQTISITTHSITTHSQHRLSGLPNHLTTYLRLQHTTLSDGQSAEGGEDEEARLLPGEDPQKLNAEKQFLET